MTHVYLPHIARNMHSPGRWEHYQQLVKALWRSTKKSRSEQSREMADQERMVRAAHRLLWEFDVPVRSEAPTESGSHIGAGWKDTDMQPKKEGKRTVLNKKQYRQVGQSYVMPYVAYLFVKVCTYHVQHFRN